MERRPARVLLVEVNEDGTVGGSHQALYDLANGLDRERFEPVVLFYQDNPFRERLTAKGVEVHLYEAERAHEQRIRREGNRIAKAFDVAVGAVRRRIAFLEEHSIDLLHLNNSPVLGCDDWLPAARLKGVPAVVSVMSVVPKRVSRPSRFLMRHFNAVIPVSRYILDDWACAGVPVERMRIVHHGVDTRAFVSRVRESPDAVRSALGVEPDQRLLVMVANVRWWKGQHVVLEALGLLDEEMRGRVLVAFVGGAGPRDEPYVDRLDALVREHDLGKVVVFLGARDDVPDLLNAADIALHASVRAEPGGIAVLEAMTLGTPVIAAEVGGHAEVLTSESGFTFDTSKPLQLARNLVTLLEDEGLRHGMGVRAKERMQEFSIERNVRETQDVYEAVLSNGRLREG